MSIIIYKITFFLLFFLRIQSIALDVGCEILDKGSTDEVNVNNCIYILNC